MKTNPYRLKRQIRPVLYGLTLELDLEKFSFRASEVLTFDLLVPADRLTLHAVDLKIRSARVFAGASRWDAARVSFQPKFETVTFHFKHKLKPGKNLRLGLEFDGALNDQMHGFYRTSYTVRGKRRWGAATQFEATDARRAFVCVDEPAAKARFDATLIVPKHLTALSNMPAVRQRLGRDGKRSITYARTPVMSTYLLCFVVAELQKVQTKDRHGVPIRVWTTPGKKEQGRFALQVAAHALPYFAGWFGIRYALPKLDMVALPDFASGAMENWGLVTYRETALLVDERHSSAQAKQRVAEVIDHELAHQWFGNLVTMEWWTDLWLNEGFASFMGPKAVDARFPEWKLWDQYVATEFFTALHDDALKTSHPIEIPVKDPHEIREIFDHVTYNKGSAVNRMLEHFLTEPKLREGLRRYLKRYRYRNAHTVDLWRALEEVSGQPVRKIMAGFTRQTGYPVVTAALQNGTLELSQRRFVMDGSADRPPRRWNVPVTFLTGSSARGSALLSGRSLRLASPVRDGAWLKLNPGQTGFYRVRYSEELLNRLRAAVRRGELSAADSLGVLEDALSLARSGDYHVDAVLDMLGDCRKTTDYNGWLTVSGVLGAAENLIDDETVRKRFHAFARGLFSDIWPRLSWTPAPSDSHSDLLLRSLVISRLGHFGDSGVIAAARERFAAFISGGALDPNLRSAVYGINAEHGEGRVWNKLCSLYKATDLQEEKVRILRAVTRFRDPAAVRRALAFSLSGQVRPQDAYVILAGFGSNGTARARAWAFVKARWKRITRMYKSGSVGLLGHILEGSTAAFTTPEQCRDVAAFFRKHPVPGTERTRLQTLEIIRSNISWKRRDQALLASWLENQG